MKKLLFLLFLLLIPIHLLKAPPQSVKRGRDDYEGIADKNENPPDKLVNNIKKRIKDADFDKIKNFLRSKTASKLSDEQKVTLFQEANHFLNLCPHEEVNDERYKKSKKIADYFYALWRLKKLKFPQALFSPIPYLPYTDTSLDEILVALIMNERVRISVCCFNFTLYNVAHSLRRQKEHENVGVEVVVDQKYQAPLRAIKHLVENNIPVFTPRYKPSEMNHHKFIIFECNLFNKSLVWAGSYNLTGNANENSWEDVIISDDKEVVEAYQRRFEEIKTESEQVTREELEKEKNTVSGNSLSRNNVPPGLQRRRPLSE